jgi:ADP-ribose diphosphatase
MVRIVAEREVFKTKFHSVKELDIEFTNKKKATYSVVEKRDSVLLVPVTKKKELVLIKEYFPAVNERRLALPKGRIDEGEDDPLTAANRELQEETSYKAEQLIKLGVLDISPGNMRHETHVYLAKNLIKSKLKGDEEEKIEVVKIPFKDFELFIERGEIKEARMIAALYLAKKHINNL